MSAVLEAQESLPPSLGPTSQAELRNTRRVHAEHHSSFALSTLRTTFALDIPSDAAPAFQVRIGGEPDAATPTATPGGLEWRVRLCLLVAVAREPRIRGLRRDGLRGEEVGVADVFGGGAEKKVGWRFGNLEVGARAVGCVVRA